MTAPIQEPTQDRAIQGLEFRTRQLFRRPPPPFAAETGWTVVFGSGTTPVVTGDYQAIWKVPREIVGYGTPTTAPYPWYIYHPSAGVVTAPTGGDVEIQIYRVDTDSDAVLSVTALLVTPLLILEDSLDSSTSVQPEVVQSEAILDYDFTPIYSSLMIGIDAANGAAGLSINVPIGVEQPPGSGYHIPS